MAQRDWTFSVRKPDSTKVKLISVAPTIVTTTRLPRNALLILLPIVFGKRKMAEFA